MRALAEGNAQVVDFAAKASLINQRKLTALLGKSVPSPESEGDDERLLELKREYLKLDDETRAEFLQEIFEERFGIDLEALTDGLHPARDRTR